MTLVEFLAPLSKGANRLKVMAVLYFKQRYEGTESLTVDQIRTAFKQARVPGAPKLNIADILAKSGHFVDSPGVLGLKRLWRLTPTGEKEVRTALQLPDSQPEIEHDVATLQHLVPKIADIEAREFVEEGIKCLQVGALRACVVFLWSGAMQVLHERAWSVGAPEVNAAVQKHDPKSPKLHRADDFAYVKDRVALLALEELGMVDKGQRATLDEALGLRNRSGHPTKYRPGVKKVSGFIEDLVGIVFR